MSANEEKQTGWFLPKAAGEVQNVSADVMAKVKAIAEQAQKDLNKVEERERKNAQKWLRVSV